MSYFIKPGLISYKIEHLLNALLASSSRWLFSNLLYGNIVSLLLLIQVRDRDAMSSVCDQRALVVLLALVVVLEAPGRAAPHSPLSLGPRVILPHCLVSGNRVLPRPAAVGRLVVTIV